MPAAGKSITVRACKYDGREHKRWPAQILKEEGSLIVLDAYFPDQVEHDLLGTIAGGTHSLEYYWLDRWYNVFRFAQPDGALRNYYCNINVPPTQEADVLTYIDLDLDVLVSPDLSYQICDVEEFERNAEVYGYSDEVKHNAHRAIDELIEMIETRAFPFDR